MHKIVWLATDQSIVLLGIVHDGKLDFFTQTQSFMNTIYITVTVKWSAFASYFSTMETRRKNHGGNLNCSLLVQYMN